MKRWLKTVSVSQRLCPPSVTDMMDMFIILLLFIFTSPIKSWPTFYCNCQFLMQYFKITTVSQSLNVTNSSL